MARFAEGTSAAPSWDNIPKDHDGFLPHNHQIRLTYNTFGDALRPCVLLIQDVACPGLYWDELFCNTLAECGFYVVRYDQRDTGKSSKFAAASKSLLFTSLYQLLGHTAAAAPCYSLHDLCRDAMGLLDVLHVPVAHLVGYSMGAAIAQQILVDYPDRVLSTTFIAPFPLSPLRSAPLLLHTARRSPVNKGSRVFAEAEVKYFQSHSGDYPFPAEEFLQRALWSYDRQQPSQGAAERHLSAVVTGGDRSKALSRLNPGYQKSSGDPLPDSTLQYGVLALATLFRMVLSPALRTQRCIGANPDAMPEMPAARHIPVTVIHGKRDHVTALAFGEEIAKCIPGALLVVFPKMGHVIPPALYGDVAQQIAFTARAANRSFA